MLVLLAFVELEVTLTAVAIGVSLRGRSRAFTFVATAVSASVLALGLVFAWIVWFVAPACIGDPNLIGCTTDRAGAGALAYVLEIAMLEWAWMLGVALVARSIPVTAGAGG